MSFIRLSDEGSLLFMRNFAELELGGGVFLTRNSKISVLEGKPKLSYGWALTIRFIHNMAAFYGGGIYVDDNFSCGAALSGQKVECFLYVESRSFLYLFFNLNEAKEGGSDLYGSVINRCYSDLFRTDKQHIFYLKNNNPTITISSQPVQVCFCKENKTDCNYQPSSVNVTKGQDFSKELVAVDQVNNSSKATIHAFTATNASGLGVGQQRSACI